MFAFVIQNVTVFLSTFLAFFSLRKDIPHSLTNDQANKRDFNAMHFVL